MLGAAHRFDDTAETGNLTAANVNSLDTGGNVYQSPNGGRNVRVTGLSYWLMQNGLRTRTVYAGQASDLLLGASVTTRLWLDSAGALQTSTVGFPGEGAVAAAAYYPLAEVVTGASAVSTITDRRPRSVHYQDPPVALGRHVVGDLVAQWPGLYGDTTGTYTADNIYCAPLVVSQSISLDALAVEVTTGAAPGAVVRLGIYNTHATTKLPAGLFIDAGTVAGDAVAVPLATFTAVTLLSGIYYVAWVASHAGTALRARNSASAPPLSLDPTNFGLLRTAFDGGAQSAAAALPATFPSPSQVTVHVPIIARRAA